MLISSIRFRLTAIGLSSSIVVLLLCLSSPVLAIDCNKAITTPDINQCAYAEQQKVELKLNQTYQRVLKMLSRPDETSNVKASLVKAQRAWVVFREADCTAIFDFWEEGTIRTVQRIGCMQEHAEFRIKQLERYEDAR